MRNPFRSWFGFGKRKPQLGRAAPKSITHAGPSKGVSVSRWKRFLAWRRVRIEKFKLLPLAEQKRIRKNRALKIAGVTLAAGMAATLYATRPRPSRLRPEPTPPGITRVEKPDLILSAEGGDPGGRIEVKPLPNESQKAYEQRMRDARELLEPQGQRIPRRIGKYLVVPEDIELRALEQKGDFKDVTGLSGGKLNYDVRNPKPVTFDPSKGEFSKNIPDGSLVLIRHVDAQGNESRTWVLYEGLDDMVRYQYPPGVHGSTDNAQNTGFTGSLGEFLTGTSWVEGYVPPNP